MCELLDTGIEVADINVHDKAWLYVTTSCKLIKSNSLRSRNVIDKEIVTFILSEGLGLGLAVPDIKSWGSFMWKNRI